MSSAGLTIKITKDTATPALRAALAQARNPQAILRAVGTQIVSIAKRAFREPSLRAAPWRPKRDGSPSNLILHGVLSKSIRITELTDRNVSVGSDRIYAAIHQLGGIIRPTQKKALKFQIGGKWFTVKKVVIPARPFLPFDANGRLIPAAEVKVRATIDRAVALQLGGGTT